MQVIKLSYEDPMPSSLQMCCSFLKVYTYAKLNFDPVSVVVPQRTGEAGLLAEQKSQSMEISALTTFQGCHYYKLSPSQNSFNAQKGLTGWQFQVLVTMPVRERAPQAH